jgi:hypothetical protein
MGGVSSRASTLIDEASAVQYVKAQITACTFKEIS